LENSIKKNRKAFSLLAALLMVVSLLAPAAAFAQPAVDGKISASLAEKFENEDTVKFVVEFAEKADTASAAANADIAGLSSEDAVVAQREAVINAAQTTADAAQTDVLSYLEANAEEVDSFFITNVIVATATQDVAEEVATFAEVAKVVPSPEVQLVEPTFYGAEVSQEEVPEIGWNFERVQAPEAWENGFDGEGIVIGNLDSGVEWNHPELIDSYRGGEGDHEAHFFDAVNGQEEAYDDNFHGTHVGGTMTGTNVGVAPNAQWIAAKGLDENGAGTLDGILEAAEWFLAPAGDAANAPNIVNNSWGLAGAHPDDVDSYFQPVIQTWHDAGIFSVFAAGNSYTGSEADDGSVEIPALYPETLAVGSIDVNNIIAEDSSRGPSPYGELKPEVSAPGVMVPSSIPGGEIAYASGTSMAAPAVSGVAALALQANADISIDNLQAAFMETTTPLTDDVYTESPNHAYGHGLVNAVTLIDAVQEDEEPEPEPEPEPVEPIERIAGDTRYDTAVEISQDGWEDGALEGQTVVLARGDDFSDALAGVPLAHAVNSPILLVPTDPIDRIDNLVAEEIERLGAETAFLLGGEVAISEEQENNLTDNGLDVTRISGEARFETAVEIAGVLQEVTGESSEVVIANGMDFPDALAVGSYAAQAGSPILLTLADRVPEATEAALEDFGFASSVVVGGDQVVSEEVAAELPEVNRLAGDDRYGTNREILEASGVTDGSELYVATGRDYADALTGAVLAAKDATGIILVHERIPAQLEEFVAGNELGFHAIFGGDQAVIDSVKEELEEAQTPSN
jgi:putative cell wall-binding protein/subtilisin family serine protease